MLELQTKCSAEVQWCGCCDFAKACVLFSAPNPRLAPAFAQNTKKCSTGEVCEQEVELRQGGGIGNGNRS